MSMTPRYVKFNEMMFEVYCKISIDNAIARERKRKAVRARWEQPFSALPDHVLYSIGRTDSELDSAEAAPTAFHVRGMRVLVNDPSLGQALTYLLPRDREIVILYYFIGMDNDEIANELNISRSTVSRRRRNAEARMRVFLEGSYEASTAPGHNGRKG